MAAIVAALVPVKREEGGETSEEAEDGPQGG